VKSPGRPYLNRLPPELADLIFEGLSVKAVRNVRLVCKELADQAAPSVLPEITVYLCSESFARIKAISEHKLIYQGVKVLWFEDDRLEPMDDDKNPRMTKHWLEILEHRRAGRMEHNDTLTAHSHQAPAYSHACQQRQSPTA